MLTFARQQGRGNLSPSEDARDANALMETGDPLDEACEACHVKDWHPESAPPGAGAGSKTN